MGELGNRLEKIVLRLRCQTRVQYAHCVQWFLMQLKGHTKLEVVVIEPFTEHIMQESDRIEAEIDHFQQSRNQTTKQSVSMLKQYLQMDLDQTGTKSTAFQPDQIDKTTLSLSLHLLEANSSQLTCWQVLFPFQSKYMKIYAVKSVELIIRNIKKSLQFFNTLHIHHIFKYFYKITNLIKIDPDGRSRRAALNIMQLFGEPSQDYCYFDNYRYGGVYSFSDCLGDFHAASLKRII